MPEFELHSGDFSLLKAYYCRTALGIDLKRAPGPSTALALFALLVGMVFTSSGSALIAHASSPYFFSTGSPDGLMGMASRIPSAGLLETEAADDFILSSATTINHATFVGLLPSGSSLSTASEVVIRIYRVFPLDSANPPSGRVPTRVDSPSDNEIVLRDSSAGDLTFTTTLISDSFTVANTVVNGINAVPSQFTGGEGPATGEEVSFDVTLINLVILPPGHYFFAPEVRLNDGTFLWLSAPRPIVGGTGPFTPDLQAWIRNIAPGALAPDWLRVGTDITHQGPFNGVFSLTGTSASATGVPEFSLPAIFVGSIALAAVLVLRKFSVIAEFR